VSALGIAQTRRKTDEQGADDRRPSASLLVLGLDSFGMALLWIGVLRGAAYLNRQPQNHHVDHCPQTPPASESLACI
jgi:hypothetical protein